MKGRPLRTLRAFQTAILIFVALMIGVVCVPPVNGQTPSHASAEGVVSSWNAAVSTIGTEDQKWMELFNSLRRNPPGRVLLTPDVRAAQRKRRLALIQEIIDFENDRIRRLRELAKFEEADK